MNLKHTPTCHSYGTPFQPPIQPTHALNPPTETSDVQLTAIQSKYNSSADEQWLVGDEQHTDGSASSAMV